MRDLPRRTAGRACCGAFARSRSAASSPRLDAGGAGVGPRSSAGSAPHAGGSHAAEAARRPAARPPVARSGRASARARGAVGRAAPTASPAPRTGGGARRVGADRTGAARPRRDRGPRTSATPARRPAAGPARWPAARERDLSPGQARRSRRSPARDRGGDPAPLLLDGVTGRRQDRGLRRGDRRVASSAAGRRWSSSPRSRWRCRWSTGCARTSTPRSRWSTRASAMASGPTSGGGSARATSTSSSARGSPSWRRSPSSGSSSWTRSTTPPTRAIGRRGSRRATSRSRSAALAGAAVVLGSATPAVDIGRAAPASGRTGASSCRTAPPASPPEVEIVDLRAELAAGNRGLLSRPLAAALAGLDADAGDQAILVINRRGTASVVLCRDCGHVQACPDCERPLVYHQAGDDAALPPLRPSDADRDPLPGLRLAADPLPRRWHGTRRARGPGPLPRPSRRPPRSRRRRAQGRRGAGHRRVRRPARLDVLVGTSLVAKGLDVPSGHPRRRRVGRRRPQPARRARRRADVPAARAGGRVAPGAATARAAPSCRRTSPTIRRSSPSQTATPQAFYDAELDLRRRFGSPPFGRLVKLTVGADRSRGRRTRGGRTMADRLRARAIERGVDGGGRGPGPRLRRRAARTGGAGTSCSAATTRSRLLDGDVPDRRGPWTSIRSRCSSRQP